jgi:hypothetical protein
LRAFDHFQVPRRQPEIEQEIGIVGVDLEGPLIGDERLVQMPHALKRHGQHVIGLSVAAIRLGRFERELACTRDVSAAPVPDRAAKKAVRLAARQRRVDFFG